MSLAQRLDDNGAGAAEDAVFRRVERAVDILGSAAAVLLLVIPCDERRVIRPGHATVKGYAGD